MVTLHVIDDARQQVVGEVAFLQFVNLCQHQTAHLFKRLTFLRSTHQDKASVVVHQFWRGESTLHLHLLVQVEIEETCLAIAQHILHQFQRIGLLGVGLQRTPSYPYLFCLLTNHRGILRLRELC